jgi:hypothetical protein
MSLADHAAALVAGIGRDQLAAMPPAHRERFLRDLRRVLAEAARMERDASMPRGGVLPLLARGDRAS